MRILVLILLGCTGCVLREDSSELVMPNPFQPRGEETTQTQVSYGPADEAVSARVREVGERLIRCNPQLTIRPRFHAVGNPQPQVFHRGFTELVISDGLVRLCPTDNELAAVLALELGNMAAECTALTRPDVGRQDVPMNMRVGNDNGYAFGAADQVHHAELGKYEAKRREQIGSLRGGPDPQGLARTYLSKACYAPQAIDNVAPWLKQYATPVTVQQKLKPSLDP